MGKDRKIDHVILGLLAHENLTGYDIKKMIDGAISFFWKGSFGSIYPALLSLEQEGLVVRAAEEGTEGAREKTVYSITEAGRQSLLAWLEQSKAANDLKYESLLKIFFGGIAEPEVTLKTVRAFEKETEENLKPLRLCRDNLKKVLDQKDHLYYYLTVTFGIRSYEAYLKWCREAAALLKKAAGEKSSR